MLYIRTDANQQIGTGHVMRCLAIASELRRRGEESTFLVSEEKAAGIIINHGYRVLLLDQTCRNYDAGADGLANLLKKEKAEKLLVDSYDMTPRFSEALGKQLALLYLGSKEEFFPDVSLLVNYSNALNHDFYVNTYDPQKTRLLLGVRYAPLREEFHGHVPAVRKTMESVLTTAGGSDENNVAGRLAKELSDCFPAFHFIIISGALNGWQDSLEKLSANNQHITVLHTPECMADIMQSCDAAVSAAGTTLYELCACGTPAVSFSLTHEQEKSAKQFELDGILPYTGDISADFNGCTMRIKNQLIKLSENVILRNKQAEQMNAAIDGKGCARIVDEILKLK